MSVSRSHANAVGSGRAPGGALQAALVACAGFFTLTAQAQVDFTGTWAQLFHMDGPIGEAEYGDYTALPLNEAGVLRAETWSDQKWTVPEHQCEPHPIDYAIFGPASMRVWSEVDAPTQRIAALHQTLQWMIPERTIWLDGRAHPSQYAPHTWMGYNTGKWVGDMLVVTTTHLKEGWLRRNGAPRSDQGSLAEYWMRHDDIISIVSIVSDPVYLEEPFVRTMNYVHDAGYQHGPYPCSARVEIERPQGFVGHWLPGTNPLLEEFRTKLRLPLESIRGGGETMYPEYETRLRQLIEARR